MTDIMGGISMMKLLPIIPTKEGIKDYFKLRDEPIYVFEKVEEGLIYVKKNMKGIAGIYGFVNKSLGKIYIGSAQDLSIRPSRHMYPSSACNKHFWKDFNEYGINEFVFIIIEIVGFTDQLEDRQLLDVEEYYLKNCKNMYNILQSTSGPSGYKHSEEIKRLISKLAKGRKVSEKTKEKLSKLFSGKGNPFYGRKHSLELKERFKSRRGEASPMYGKEKSPEFMEYMGGGRSGKLNFNAVPYSVKDITTGEISTYPTYKEAVEYIGGSRAGIRKAVNKKRTYKGRWEIKKII